MNKAKNFFQEKEKEKNLMVKQENKICSLKHNTLRNIKLFMYYKGGKRKKNKDTNKKNASMLSME